MDMKLIFPSLNHSNLTNSLGMEAFERLGFLASFGPHGTGRTEGGEKTQPFKLIPSRLFTLPLELYLFLFRKLHPTTYRVITQDSPFYTSLHNLAFSSMDEEQLNPVDLNLINDLWVPNVFIYNLKTFKVSSSHQSSFNNRARTRTMKQRLQSNITKVEIGLSSNKLRLLDACSLKSFYGS